MVVCIFLFPLAPTLLQAISMLLEKCFHIGMILLCEITLTFILSYFRTSLKIFQLHHC